MKTDELREKYLEFFQSKGHRLCASDVLVPRWDKSVLFTPAGMNPFKDHFLGKVHLEFTRATSCQKCLRTGDIDNVGRTAYHHTFFEMLGNFSFGDYFKREAIAWAWEFLTEKKWLGMDANRLSVTVYLDDDEAAGIWQNEIGLPPARIQRLDEKENFWPASAPSSGPDGVCGPCSEIYFHPPDGSKEVEIWNLVFTQFNRDGAPPDNLKPLPSKNIDTGMGLERIAATMQGVTTNYHIDILRPIVEAAAEICQQKYEPASENGRRFRRMADHVRACTFAIHENVYPGPAKQEYVVRRLLRRAVLDGHQVGLRDPFLFQLVPTVAEMMRRPYPELGETVERVADVIRREENAFLEKIDGGLVRMERIFSQIQASGRNEVKGADAAELYQTHGVPPEMFEQIAREREVAFDWDGYRAAMDQHSIRSGTLAETVMGSFGPVDAIKSEVKSTLFLGYESESCRTTVRGIAAGESRLEVLTAADGKAILVLSESPFYAESGGQVGDQGVLGGPSGEFHVVDTQKDGDVWLHIGQCTRGEIRVGDEVQATVDADRRSAIRRAHSATHVLHFALQQQLGSHAQQRGSKVTDDLLRFDFSNPDRVAIQDLDQIEAESNRRVKSAVPVSAEVIPMAEARQRGAMMLFGEKYPDPVRMVSIGEFSRELCGGTHVNNSAEIGLVEVVSEEGVSSGTRRIEALTGPRAEEFRRNALTIHETASRILQVGGDLLGAVEHLLAANKELKKQIDAGKSADAAGDSRHAVSVYTAPDYAAVRESLRSISRVLNIPQSQIVERVQTLLNEHAQLLEQVTQLGSITIPTAEELLAAAVETAGARIIARELSGGNANLMRQLIDQVRQKNLPVAIYLAAANGPDKVLLVAGVSRELVARGVSAGDWVRETAPAVGGGGGGKPDLAQAGGKQPENIQLCLKKATDVMTAWLESGK